MSTVLGVDQGTFILFEWLGIVPFFAGYAIFQRLGGWPEAWWRIRRKPGFIQYVYGPDGVPGRFPHLYAEGDSKIIRKGNIGYFSYSEKHWTIEDQNITWEHGWPCWYYNFNETRPIPIRTWNRGHVAIAPSLLFAAYKNDAIERMHILGQKKTRYTSFFLILAAAAIGAAIAMISLYYNYNTFCAVTPEKCGAQSIPHNVLPFLFLVPGMIWEHLGDNRSGKTLFNAAMAWEAYNTCSHCGHVHRGESQVGLKCPTCQCDIFEGRTVYCNCMIDERGSRLCTLNFPHEHLDPYEYYGQRLLGCYIMSDESADDLSSRQSQGDEREGITKFSRQVKKRGIDWHYDCIRHKDIDVRIRLNPDYILESFRYPSDINKPLQAIKIESSYRYSTRIRTFWFHQPWLFFPVYNHIVLDVAPNGGLQLARPTVPIEVPA